MRRLRRFACVDCGELTTRKRESGQPLVCSHCSVTRAVREADRLHNDRLLRQAARRQAPTVELLDSTA